MLFTITTTYYHLLVLLPLLLLSRYCYDCCDKPEFMNLPILFRDTCVQKVALWLPYCNRRLEYYQWLPRYPSSHTAAVTTTVHSLRIVDWFRVNYSVFESTWVNAGLTLFIYLFFFLLFFSCMYVEVNFYVFFFRIWWTDKIFACDATANQFFSQKLRKKHFLLLTFIYNKLMWIEHSNLKFTRLSFNIFVIVLK